ncbi:DUF4347 domain-containing protein [Pseudanabaena sp. FACHB-2040]|uniref:DUF4347 domain-containing protein n=1 Tax=Pseudanabaena sp. FACHB-2040 TaxID=2692859 RepID=UPI001686E409|nr:DUF4347 domain-containing protein [Pseudanabaena sp. FACHB-2040]MBD2257439.1 DUF4347 domain-containing protein [Pseudanabaena sp. FACHB-2040]
MVSTPKLSRISQATISEHQKVYSSENANIPQVNTSMLVIIDAGVDDYEFLVSGVVPGASVVVLNSEQDGVAQITQALEKATVPVTELHIVSHGAPGTLYLGNTQLSLETLNYYAPQISQWLASSDSLLSPPSLLLYGCNIAAGDAGEEFIEKLQSLAKASILASTTKTGTSSLGGDWNFQIQTGSSQAKAAFTSETILEYSSIMASVVRVEAPSRTYGLGEPVRIRVHFDSRIVHAHFDDPGSISLQLETGQNDAFARPDGSWIPDWRPGFVPVDYIEFTYTPSNGESSLDLDYTSIDALFSASDIGFEDGTWLWGQTISLPAPGSAGSLSNTSNVVIASSDLNGNLTAGPLSEPTALATAIDASEKAVSVFDFAIGDGGGTDGGDNLPLGVTQVRVNVIQGPEFANQVTWLLNGPDLGSDVQGTYANGVITFSNLPISVANATGETYVVKAFYNNTIGLVDGQKFALSIDGDTDLTISSGGTRMGATEPVTNGAGFAVKDDIPPIVTKPSLAMGSDSGISPTDNITNITQPTFTGLVNEGNSKIAVYSDLNGKLGEVTADAQGNWQLTSDITLTSDNHRITVQAIDPAGNFSLVSDSLSLTIDNTVPLIPSITSISEDTGMVNDDFITQSTSPTFSGNAEANSKVMLFVQFEEQQELREGLGLLQVGESIADAEGNWSVTLAEEMVLPDGGFSFVAGSVDLAGNLSELSPVTTVTVDNTAPLVTSVTSLSENKTYLAGDKIDFAITFSEAVFVSGTPELALNLVKSEASAKYISGVSSNASAEYISGSGTSTLTFSYTVQAQDASLDLDYLSKDALALFQGASIVDAAGNQGNLALADPGSEGSLGFGHNILIKGFADTKVGVVRNNYISFNLFSKLENLSSGISAENNPVEMGGINLADIFDETYYLSQNPDVANAVNFGVFKTGYEHFSSLGWKEGRSPSILFNEQYYLSQNTDIAKAVTDKTLQSGLEHFLLFGHKEGRNSSTAFNQQDYLTQNSDIKDAVAKGLIGSGFEHYVEYGAFENRASSLSLYNEAYYLQQNQDVAGAIKNGAFQSGFEHFVSFGQREGRVASTLFSEASYLASNPDVQGAVSSNAFTSGFEHYVEYGRAEGRIS